MGFGLEGFGLWVLGFGWEGFGSWEGERTREPGVGVALRFWVLGDLVVGGDDFCIPIPMRWYEWPKQKLTKLSPLNLYIHPGIKIDQLWEVCPKDQVQKL